MVPPAADVPTIRPRGASDEPKKAEDAIPDLPENQATRDFLKNAPSKGLWLPMGLGGEDVAVLEM